MTRSAHNPPETSTLACDFDLSVYVVPYSTARSRIRRVASSVAYSTRRRDRQN